MADIIKSLTSEEVLNNQKLYGKNVINHKRKNILIIILEFLIKQPIFYFAILCISLYIYNGEILNCILFSIISIIILLIHSYLLIKIKKVMKIMCKNKKIIVTVIRDDKEKQIYSDELTINDIVILKKGDKIEADSIILECDNLCVDETNLGGNIVNKSFDLLDKNAKYKSNYVYSNTFVTNGIAKVKVMNIGNNREFVKNIKNNCKITNNNLVKKANKFSKILTVFIILLSLISIISVIINKTNIILGLLSSISILLNIIPLNYSLIIFYHQINGIYKNISKSAVIKDINNLETLKDLSYLIVDKTNYITLNKMKVKEVYSNNIHNEELIKNGLLALNCEKNDKLKKAIEEVNTQYIEDYKIIKRYPYSNKTKIIANIYEKDNEKFMFAVGNLESIFDISDLDVEQKYKLYTFQKDLYKRGLHILAVSSDLIEKEEDDFFNYNLHFDGIITFYEPLKDDIKDVVKQAQNMNINIIMLTEDNELISKKIGNEIGLKNYENVITNKELNDIKIEDKINDLGIIINISEKNKERIINYLKNNNKKVGATINDLQINNGADINISIEKLDNDLIYDKSDLVLLEDNFKVIIDTINKSKNIYNNIKNILKYLIIVTCITTIITSVLSIIFNIMISPIYILILIFIYSIISIMLYRK